MKLSNLSRVSLKSIGRSIGIDVQMVEGHLQCTSLAPDDPRYSLDFVLPSMKMIDACRADDFDFFLPFIDAGMLTIEQMHNAAERYHLGKTKSGQPIFWMIDDMHTPLDAHIGNDTWISALLKAREPLLEYWQVQHCLFGQHLITNTDLTNLTNKNIAISAEQPHSCNSRHSWSEKTTICVVESEQSAMVLSELFPECTWMAYVNTLHLCPDLFEPLQGHTVTIYPRTDPTLSTFLFFEDLVDITRRQYDIDISVDATLEDHATADQKDQCIDILNFILES